MGKIARVVLLFTCGLFPFVICSNKLKVCIVDGRGGFRKAGRYCPTLDSSPDSKAECVIGVDRLDCLRRLSKARADFSVFTPEDLVTASNSQMGILLTHEMRYIDQPYEYEVVAVINDLSGIKSRYELKGKRFCHPGYGYETDWTRILSNFLESTVVPQMCDPRLTLTENRIKASSKFFKSACKAGPWVMNSTYENQLKSEYHNLCDSCGIPEICTTNDKYWGRRGSLFCLTDGAGDISWARLDDVKSHFGLSNQSASLAVARPDGYSYLCPDGAVLPVNSSRPCVWVVKPWSVVAATRTKAQDVQALVSSLTHDNTWKGSLLNLIERYSTKMKALDPIEAIESYLIRSNGFLSANGFTGCHPPRTVRICTITNIENAKCGWLRESLAVYGVEPDVECIRADNKTHCLQAVKDKLADVVMIHPDLALTATRDYSLKTLFFEAVQNEDKHVPIALVKTNSGLNTFESLRGKRACFPSYEGTAWNSIIYILKNASVLPRKCPYSDALAEFFGDSCVPDLPIGQPDSLRSLCKDDYVGHRGALKCLIHGDGDVAFLELDALNNLLEGQKHEELWLKNLKANDVHVICPENDCHLSWTSAGRGMVRKDISNVQSHEIYDVFMSMNGLFGKHYKTPSSPFTLFGLFDGQKDVLFDDVTVQFSDRPVVMRQHIKHRDYDWVLNNISVCVSSGNPCVPPFTSMITVSYTLLSFLVFNVFVNC